MTAQARRRRERQERRTSIVDAAEEVFLERGFWAATMDQVAARAELSKGTLYLYFKNKDDLLLAMGSRVLQKVVDRLQELSRDERSTGAGMLRNVLLAYSEIVLSVPGRFRLAVSWMVSEKQLDVSTPAFERHRDLVTAVMQHIIAAIDRGQADGSLRAGAAPPALATYVWASMVGALLARSNGDEFARVCPAAYSAALRGDGFVETFVLTLVSGLATAEVTK